MKKIIFTILTLISTLHFCFSQDVITKKTSEDIEAKITEVSAAEIKYKKFAYQNGPTYSILISEVLMIRYENGSKDIFNEEKKNDNLSTVNPSGEDLNTLGKSDASKYYKSRGAGTGTLITSLVSPLVGLIPAIACSSTKPKESNLNYPNTDLMKKSEYYDGYTKKAKKIKQGRVWRNWGIGLGVNLIAAFLITSGI